MIRKINRVNEEIARWAFEIIFKKNDQWTIAFTNPTAGPWKTIKSNSLNDGSYQTLLVILFVCLFQLEHLYHVQLQK